MSEDSQIIVPRSFSEIFIPAGKIKPLESRETIAERYEFCEDLAQMLVEQARAKQFDLQVTERDVLERIGRGLDAQPELVTAPEGRWVLRRLAELLDWQPLEGTDVAGP
jgi:hypothetical protein